MRFRNGSWLCGGDLRRLMTAAVGDILVSLSQVVMLHIVRR